MGYNILVQTDLKCSEKGKREGINEETGYNGRTLFERTSLFLIMCYIRAFCLFLIVQNKVGDARDRESLPGAGVPHSWHPFEGEISSQGSDVSEKPRNGIFDHIRPFKGKREENHSQMLNNLNGSSLKELASRVTEILDRISRNWALEGAKTIQNGEIRLRKLNKDLNEKIGELIMNDSKYGHFVLGCMNKTVFEIGLEKILEETTECYSKSLLSIERQLKRIEEEEGAILERMENYGKNMFDMLSACFLKNNVPGVIECLQQVDGTDIGNHVRDREATNLIVEITDFVSDIPRTFSVCTSKSLVETEAHVRNGYAHSLACLKENIT